MMPLTRQQTIDELKSVAEFFESQTGATPVCLIRAVELLEEDEVRQKKILKILSQKY